MKPNRTPTPDGPNTSGYDSKPARIELTNGRDIHAAHHFPSENEDWVYVYLGERADGIDYHVPRERITIIDMSPTVTGDIANSDNDRGSDSPRTGRTDELDETDEGDS